MLRLVKTFSQISFCYNSHVFSGNKLKGIDQIVFPCFKIRYKLLILDICVDNSYNKQYIHKNTVLELYNIKIQDNFIK